MHLPSLTALASLALASALSLTINVPSSPPSLPNPNVLPPSTHATLSSLSVSASAPLTDRNTFVFRNLTQGSYLLDIHAATHAFIPLRVDVAADGTLYAWETHRGNDWENKGEALPTLDFGVRGGEGQRGFNARVIGSKTYFIERSKFNIVNIVMKNPMILMGLVTMGLFLGMPYLMNNMDPEMRAEFEARQSSNPLSSILSGQAGGQQAAPSFDMAGFLAGSSAPQRQASGGNGGGNGGKKARKA
ncbi:hypothetical protein F5X68DRAFT_212910 [Plectosphaerella plurivora]|uniref:ER membrane protein complex subunit 7 beta-sandwich domain-containing protein n=1 Tax=Plectosphaerella plurivora TaxID=936078 RepID=A0A9P8V5X5_9PEZI|nr:hypothetical protein F5X68DRAFT_212910 [Plectosphaerella plurivora]